ncbi:hypothetical protein HMPREF9176_0006 [Streptococcus downei F0415]|uniref:hypothetical protein n=1 Tax=Streptococcus downei TaxID=1317 RepID=UPI0001E994BF|nr:hypothetical protein [Streptococcus downei]EFQ57737.1 hypothetical protein HMPREF9176_0006 [Streptococcus downei F0415]
MKEHYSGILKIEFSPIFIQGSDDYGSVTANIIPVVYDKHGNRALLGQQIKHYPPVTYGYPDGISTLEIHDGKDFIEMETPYNNRANLSKYQHLPEKAKFRSATSIDDNIDALKEIHELNGVAKSEVGSPEAKISYNFKLKTGDYSKWH